MTLYEIFISESHIAVDTVEIDSISDFVHPIFISEEKKYPSITFYIPSITL